MLTLALACALTAAPQEAGADAQTVLASLIARTNVQRSFRAVYVMQRDDKPDGRFELRFRAPGKLTLLTQGAAGETSQVAIVGGELWMHAEGSAAGSLAGLVDLGDRGGSFEEAMSILQEVFPRPTGQADVNVRVSWGVNASTKKTDVEVKPAYVRTGQSRLLGWLASMQKIPGTLTLEGGVLVHESERVRAEVDASNGFLTKLVAHGADGNVRTFTLESLELDKPMDDALFERPAVAETARDISAELRKQMFAPPQVRNESLLHIDTLMRRGEREWNEALRADATRFLTALHAPVLRANLQGWVQGLQDGVVVFCGELRERRAAGGAPAELADAVAQHRTAMVEALASTRAKILAGLASGPRMDEPSPHWTDLRALEDQIVGEMFDKLGSAPLLEAFDGETAKALTD